MRTEFFHEPELQFGNGGLHVDVRYGLAAFGPFDVGTTAAPTELRLGVVGTHKTIHGIREWLERTGEGVRAKKSRLENLFPEFPGFSKDSCFKSETVFDDRWYAEISQREVDAIRASKDPAEAVQSAVDLFLDYAQDIASPGGPSVIICVPPSDLLGTVDAIHLSHDDPLDQEIDEGSDSPQHVSRDTTPCFHDLLKARGMNLGIPIQMVRPRTYGIRPRGKSKIKKGPDPIQDEATRAWNLHVALYYKAGGIPWRLQRQWSEYSSCFVGISFFRSLDGERLLTSVAQVFNERGEGIIVKGGLASIDKVDRQPHLDRDGANDLLKRALRIYRREHKNTPARVVIHKTSAMNDKEVSGFAAAVDEERVEMLDLLSVRRSFSRLFRVGTYPPLRGTYLEMSRRKSLLYLRGSVNFFKAYPGMYVPRPLEISVSKSSLSTAELSREVLFLSKLNWNNTQFDGGEPITIRAARRVGDILKCVPEDGEIQPSFRFFM